MDLFLDSQFYSVLLYVCPYASIIHFDYITFVLSFETKKSESSNFVLFQDFATCNFIQIWESAYIFLQKSPLEFCSSLLWLYRSLRTSIDVLTMLSLPTHEYCLAIYLSCWGIFLLFLFFWQFLLWKGVGFLSNAFSVNISTEMMIRFPIHSSKVVYYIDWFSYVEKTYLWNPGIFLFFDILFSFWWNTFSSGFLRKGAWEVKVWNLECLKMFCFHIWLTAWLGTEFFFEVVKTLLSFLLLPA